MNNIICPKCGGPMLIHYGFTCPLCDIPQPDTRKIYDFFKIATYIAAHEGYPWGSGNLNSWVRKVLLALDFPGNDCIISYCVLDDPEEYVTDVEYEFAQGLQKYFDISENDSILLSISW